MNTNGIIILAVVAVGGFLLYQQMSRPAYGQGGVQSGAQNSDSNTGGVGAGTGGGTFDDVNRLIDTGQVIAKGGKEIYDYFKGL